MIIRVPTGLYAEMLPKRPSDIGNVTFLISNQTPTRTDLIYPKIPQSIIERPKSLRTKDILRRRPTMGDLAFTISNSNRTELGNNNKIYETGQILNFDDTSLKTLDPMLVSSKGETRHDINKLDYNSINIDEEGVAAIEARTLLLYEKLTKKLNQLRADRKNSEVIIESNQKIINDTKRTLNALNIILSEGEDNEIALLKQRLESKIIDSEKIIEETILQANNLAAEASELQDRIKTIATVLK